MMIQVELGQTIDWAAWGQIATGVLSVGVAAVAVFVSVITSRRASADAAATYKLQARLAVNDQMSRYLADYRAIAREGIMAHTVGDYCRLHPHERTEHQLLVGQLIMLVEAMHEAADPRAAIWKNYIGVMQGPLWDEAAVEAYAASPAFRRFVVEKQDAIRGAHPYVASLKQLHGPVRGVRS